MKKTQAHNTVHSKNMGFRMHAKKYSRKNYYM